MLNRHRFHLIASFLLLISWSIAATVFARSPQSDDFSISIDPTSAVVRPGDSVKFTVTIMKDNPAEQVLISLINAPAGLVIFDNSGNPDANKFYFGFDALLTDVIPNTYTITVAASNSAFTHSASATVSVINTPVIDSLTYDQEGRQLYISGIGFGLSPIVKINDVDISDRIIGASDISISLQGGRKKLNISKGENQLTVIANGQTSQIFEFKFK